MCDSGACGSPAAEFLDNARGGRATTLGSPDEDVTKGYSWGCERTIPASAIKQAVLKGHRVCLVGARISGNLTLTHVSTSSGVELHRCYLDGGVRLDWGAADYVDLSGSCVERLSAEHLEVTHSVTLRNVHCRGPLSLRSASVGGDLLVSGTFLQGLDCDRASVMGDVEVENADIHAQTESIKKPARGGCAPIAISASRMQVGGSLCFTDHLELGGAVYLHQCTVQENLEVDGATLRPNGGEPDRDLFVARGSRVQREFLWRPHKATGGLDLREAQVGLLRMPGPRAGDWPADIRLRGLTYQAFSPQVDPRDVAEWLRRVSRRREFHAQPFEQVARVYRAQGQTAAARRVLIAKQHSRREQQHPLQQAILSAHWALAGYGYWPVLLLGWLALLSAVGAWVFADETSLVALDEGNGVGFYPFLYSLDTTLPVVDLGQQRNWVPDDLARLSFYWLCIIAGWVFAAVGASGLAEHLAKRRP